jgi:hypothetical protein
VALVISTVKWCESILKDESKPKKSLQGGAQGPRKSNPDNGRNKKNQLKTQFLQNLSSKEFENLLERVRVNNITYRELVPYFMINPNRSYISQFDFYKVLTRMNLNCSIHRVVEFCSVENTNVTNSDENPMLEKGMPDLHLGNLYPS